MKEALYKLSYFTPIIIVSEDGPQIFVGICGDARKLNLDNLIIVKSFDITLFYENGIEFIVKESNNGSSY